MKPIKTTRLVKQLNHFLEYSDLVGEDDRLWNTIDGDGSGLSLWIIIGCYKHIKPPPTKKEIYTSVTLNLDRNNPKTRRKEGFNRGSPIGSVPSMLLQFWVCWATTWQAGDLKGLSHQQPANILDKTSTDTAPWIDLISNFGPKFSSKLKSIHCKTGKIASLIRCHQVINLESTYGV